MVLPQLTEHWTFITVACPGAEAGFLWFSFIFIYLAYKTPLAPKFFSPLQFLPSSKSKLWRSANASSKCRDLLSIEFNVQKLTIK